MIKCEVNLCGVVSRNAVVKKDSDGNEFFVFGVSIPLTGRNGEKKTIEISVSNNGGKGKAAVFTTGKRVAVNGTMNIIKRDGKLYFNLRSNGDAEVTSSKAEDNFEGTMSFRGKIGKKGVSVLKDKNDKEYKRFTAFSSDRKSKESNPEFTWVNFMYFDPKEGEDFLVADKYIECQGGLQLGVFKNEVSIDCRVTEVKEWIL